MPQFLFEFSYAFRLLRKNPVQSLACVLMIGLGMAMSLVVVLILYNTQYKPFDFENAKRWTVISTIEIAAGISSTVDGISPYTYQRLKSEVDALEEAGAMRSTKEIVLEIDSGSTIMSSASISPNLLVATGIQAGLGRIFSDLDSESGRQSTVILSYETWRNSFAGTEGVINETVILDRKSYTIIGVMPQGFELPFYFDFLLPLSSMIVNDPLAAQENLTVFGILNKGDEPASVTVELQTLYARMQQQYPEVFTSDYALEAGLLRGAVSNTNGFGIIGLLRVFALIIFALACLNVSSLLLARSLERRQEYAIRTALGSARWQIVRQSLQESFLLCAFGTLLGVMCAAYALGIYNDAADAMTINGSGFMREQSSLTMDGFAILTAAAVALVFWVACSFVPALAFSRSQIDQVLKDGGAGASDGKKFRATKTLVGFEIVMSVYLLILCGGLVGSMTSLANFDYGLTTENKVVSRIRLPDSDYEAINQRLVYLENLRSQLEESAGVNSVVFTSHLPYEVPLVSYVFEDSDLNSNASVLTQFNLGVSSNYFEASGISIVNGRGFSSEDRQETQPVVIVDELLANRLWPAESPLGKQVQLNPDSDDASYTVVGIAAHVSQVNSFLNADKVGTFYQPVSQTRASELAIVVDQNLVFEDYVGLVNGISARIDRNVVLFDHSGFNRYLEGKSMHFELLASLFIWIGVTAIVLASTGIFSIISRSALQRIKEMGIRQALGSNSVQVTRIYLNQGLKYMLMGGILGVGLGLPTTMLMVTAFTDMLDYFPLVLTSVLLGMGLLVFIASYLPAKKAVAIEPGEALRYE